MKIFIVSLIRTGKLVDNEINSGKRKMESLQLLTPSNIDFNAGFTFFAMYLLLISARIGNYNMKSSNL